MRNGSILVVLLAGVALLLAGGGQGRSADNPVLTGVVGPAFAISLVGSDGQPVSTLVEGTYTINVSDRSPNHDFHLFGPGVNQTTAVTEMGETRPGVASGGAPGSVRRADMKPRQLMARLDV